VDSFLGPFDGPKNCCKSFDFSIDDNASAHHGCALRPDRQEAPGSAGSPSHLCVGWFLESLRGTVSGAT